MDEYCGEAGGHPGADLIFEYFILFGREHKYILPFLQSLQCWEFCQKGQKRWDRKQILFKRSPLPYFVLKNAKPYFKKCGPHIVGVNNKNTHSSSTWCGEGRAARSRETPWAVSPPPPSFPHWCSLSSALMPHLLVSSSYVPRTLVTPSDGSVTNCLPWPANKAPPSSWIARAEPSLKQLPPMSVMLTTG